MAELSSILQPSDLFVRFIGLFSEFYYCVGIGNLHSLQDPVPTFDQITRGRKVQIYNTIVKSILLYGAESWRMTEADKRKILAVERDALKRSCRESRREKIRNEQIRETTNVKHAVVDKIERRQLIWFGHVKRMGGERLPNRIMEWLPPEKRKRGRPTRS